MRVLPTNITETPSQAWPQDSMCALLTQWLLCILALTCVCVFGFYSIHYGLQAVECLYLQPPDCPFSRILTLSHLKKLFLADAHHKRLIADCSSPEDGFCDRKGQTSALG